MNSYIPAITDNASLNDLDSPYSQWEVKLRDEDIWQRFNKETTEMIITKGGRRLFPHLEVTVDGLNPTKTYCVLLQMEPATHCKYKYSPGENAGWVQSGSEEAQNPRRLYVHPQGPAKGDFWMASPINFNKLKITNTTSPPAGQIVLSSMHKYQPYIIIAETSEPQKFTYVRHRFFRFDVTQFIAVTAYQNQRITKLKIEYNPFAKGFRENGQAKCKRKWMECEQEDDDDIDVVSVGEDEAKRSPSPAPAEELPRADPKKREKVRSWRPWEEPTSPAVPLSVVPNAAVDVTLSCRWYPNPYASHPSYPPYFYSHAYPQRYPDPYLYSCPCCIPYSVLPRRH